MNLIDKFSLKEFKPRATQTRLGLVALVLLLATVVVAPFYLSRPARTPDGDRVWELIATHDLPNFMPMMKQFDKVLRSGVLYPRWNPDFNKGYGTATANFYPPGSFYVTSLINSVINNWTFTLLVLCTLSLAASAFSFYLLSRSFYSRLASIVAALLYMLLPIHQMDLYWRGGIPQFVGYAFMPIVLYFAYKLGSEGSLKYYAALGGFHGIYLLTHIPVGYLFTYVVALYAVLWAVRDKTPRVALRIAGGMAISILVSAIYWLPAALEGKYAYEWATEVFPYHHVYLSLAPNPDPFTINIQAIFTYNALALIVTYVILRTMGKSNASYSDQLSSTEEQRTRTVEFHTRIWIILGILTPFMTTSFSIHISKLIPRIQIATPPFRWLAVASLFTSLLIAASIDVLLKHRELGKTRRLAYQLSLGVVIFLNLWLTVRWIIPGALSNPTFVPTADFVDGGFTPRGSTLPDRLPDTPQAVITPEGGDSQVVDWLPTHRKVAVRVDQPSELRMKTYNFPGWTARIDGKPVTMRSDKDGVQQIDVSPGIHIVETSFDSTPARTAGTLISVLGFLLVLGLSFANRLERRKVEAERAIENSADQGAIREQFYETQTVSSALRPRISKLRLLAVFVVAITVGTAIIVMITSKRGQTGRPGSAASDPPKTGGTQGVGDDVLLYLPGRDSVIIAVDEEASTEIVSAFASRNQAALDALVASGRALLATNNTRAKVVQTSSGRTKVRILEGPHILVEGWVPERWLR